MNMNISTRNRGSFHQSLSGKFKVAVVDGTTGNVVWEQPNYIKNLILNNGMDRVYTSYYSDIAAYGIAGVGTRVNSIDSATSTVTLAGTDVTLTPVGLGMWSFTGSAGGYSQQLEDGDVIQLSDGTEITVTGNIQDLTTTSSVSGTAGPLAFVIWKTSQTSLQSERRRGGTGITDSYYLTGAGNCGTSIVDNVAEHLRTIDFPMETGSGWTYTEVGVGWNATLSAPSTTFSRILLPSSVAVAAGQRLRLVYQLNVAFYPTASISLPSAVITNWPVAPATNTNASESLQNFYLGAMSYVTTAGLSFYYYGALDPASSGNACRAFASTTSNSLSAYTDHTSRAGNVAEATTTKQAYVVGSYYLDKSATWDLTQINRTDISSFGLGGYGGPPFTYDTGQVYCMVFEQTQSKSNVETLTMAWRYTWGRTLTNGA